MVRWGRVGLAAHRDDEGRHGELEQPGALYRLDLVLAALEARLGLRLAPRDPRLRGQLLDQQLPAVGGVGAAASCYVVGSAGVDAFG